MSGRLAIVGEAPGEQEELLGRFFVGPSGRELDSWLAFCGLDRASALLTNVFHQRPPSNNIEAWCTTKLEAGSDYPLPPLRAGKYLRRDLALPALSRLRDELELYQPTCILALGNTALWALCSRTGIGSVRGTVLPSTLLPGTKVLPTYHPAAVLRDYSLSPLAVRDLQKVSRELEFPEIRRPARQILIPETLQDVLTYSFPGAGPLSLDIETSPKLELLLCIGLSTDPAEALVVPFVDLTRPEGSYWSEQDEVQVWRWLQLLLDSPRGKLGQNLIYDVQWLMRHHCWPRHWRADTMIGHHSLYSELPKGLADLGSYYTDEVAWKTERPRGQHTFKREE